MTGLASVLALAVVLPAAAQVASTRPLTVARPTTTMVLAPTPARTQTQLPPEQREWLVEYLRLHPGFDPVALDAAARERFSGQSEASLEYLIQQAARLAAGDNQEQQRQLQAQLAALEAQKRALRNRTEQKESEVAGKELASTEQQQAAHDAYLKAPTVRMQVGRVDRLSPSLGGWVKSEARAIVDRGATPDPDLIASDARRRLGGQDFDDADIEALVYLVLMEASKAAQDDMRDIMEQMKAQNERKAALREATQAQRAATVQNQAAARPELQAICVDPPCKPQLDAAVSRAADQKDSMSEMGETQSLRLQMLMDRRSKSFETLSNLLKKYSDTASTISSNLK